MCWLGQRLKNHVLSQNTEFTDYKEIFRVLKEWCKLKQNEIASFTKLRDLRQRNLSLCEFINTAQLLVQECKYPSDSDRLLQDVIVSGVNSITAYKWCIAIGMNLTLEKTIKICTAENSTRSQIESLRPDLTNRALNISALDQKEGHKFNARCSPPKWTSFKHKYPESTQSTESNNSKCFFCGGPQAHKDRSKCPAVNKESHNCKIVRHFNKVCKKPRVSPKTSCKIQVKHIQSQSLSTSHTREFIEGAPSTLQSSLHYQWRHRLRQCIKYTLVVKAEVLKLSTNSQPKLFPYASYQNKSRPQKQQPSHKKTLDVTISKLPSSTNRLWGQYRSWMQCTTSLQSWSLIWTRMTRLSNHQWSTSKHMGISLFTI